MNILTLLVACTQGTDPDSPTLGGSRDTDGVGYSEGEGTSGRGDTVGGELVCSPRANLEVVGLDIWGRDLLTQATWEPQPAMIGGIVALGEEPARFSLLLGASGHNDAVLEIDYGAEGPEDITVSGPGGWRWASSFSDGDCPVHTLYVGLDHQWFSPAAAPPTRNDVDLLMDGEEGWEAIYDDVATAQERVVWATWFWESDFELVREPWADADERAGYTALGVLESLPDVDRKVLINRFWGENTDYSQYINTDSALRSKAHTAGDGFDVVLQGNATEVPIFDEYDVEPAEWSFTDRVRSNDRYAGRAFTSPGSRATRGLELQAASWHQKAIVVDGQVAFVSGMNTKAADWDSSEHHVFDERRMGFDADEDDRLDVWHREDLPDIGPRKDYTLRLEGPAARDVEAIFWRRWETSLDQGLLYAENATRFDLDGPAEAGGALAQVVATMPGEEMAILETHRKAIEQATDYILIEDQYFRAPLLDEVLLQRLHDEPELRVLVVTQPVSEWDPGLKHTYLAWEKLTQQFPERVLFLQLRTWDMVAVDDWIFDDAYFYDEPIGTHSKLRLVDDVYLSVGSCNFNNRGYLYEGELNVSVLDEALAAQARVRILSNYVGPEYARYLTGEMENDMDVLALVADNNKRIVDYWSDWAYSYDDVDEIEADWASYQPDGFVFPVTFSDDYFDVGPDAF
jgi:phosphatidylserine/phosphatidylglycerophosphate/cardiolipin synthase-like enzyme